MEHQGLAVEAITVLRDNNGDVGVIAQTEAMLAISDEIGKLGVEITSLKSEVADLKGIVASRR